MEIKALIFCLLLIILQNFKCLRLDLLLDDNVQGYAKSYNC